MNAIVMQCGGPTAVVNASLWGVIAACQEQSRIRRLWGARHGLRGLIRGDWVELTGFQNQESARLELQPGAALGSGRDRQFDTDLPDTLDQLHHFEISTVFVIGGNGSMAAAHKLHRYAARVGYQVKGTPLRVIGIPKTIDNDLAGTDFAPGYGSAARFIAQTTLDVGVDLITMRGFDDVAVLEVMGRHVGWLAAAAALSRWDMGAPPYLILLPEVPLDEERFLAAVQHQHQQHGVCLVIVAEGVRDQAGVFLAEKSQPIALDASGQKLLSFAASVTPYLARLVGQRLGLRCRQIRPDTIQRSSRNLASSVDRTCAMRAGTAAVDTATAGYSDVMIGLERHLLGWRPVPVPLTNIVGQERRLPSTFIAAEFDVTPAFLAYARPLIDGWHPDVFTPFTQDMQHEADP